MPSQHPRCVEHGLAVAPDGLCVLCRRQAGAPLSSTPASQASAEYSAAPERLRWKLTLTSVLASLLLTAAVVALLRVRNPAGAPGQQPTAATSQLPEPGQTQLTPSEQSALNRSKAGDLAASLALLERAEAQRKAEQQLAAAQQEQQRTAALAAQQQEQAERDQARHAAVTRQLDAQSLQQGRRKVLITLYGTDWCGVCQRARAYMRRQNISFKDFDIDHDDAARAKAYALNPRHSVPVIAIDQELLIGFSPDSLEEHITRAAQAYKL